MYYVTETKEELEAYNERIAEAKNYDGVYTVRWSSIVEHQDGTKFAILKCPAFPLIEGVDENDEPLDAPTVDSIADFYPPIEE
mgnify:CR=1 FL=1|jgi:hypothetical protein